MADINDILSSIRSGTTDLAKQIFGSAVSSAEQDGSQFLDLIKADLEKWAGQLASKQITPSDFEDLLEGDKDLTEMQLLKQAGETLIKIDKFKSGLLDLISKTVLSKV